MADNFYSKYPNESTSSTGVTSLNTLTGDLTLVAGTGISLTVGVDTITIDATATSGANTALSNLTTTAINTDLIPDSDVTWDLGSTAFAWNKLFLSTISDSSDLTVLDVVNRTLNSVNGNDVLNFSDNNAISFTANLIPTADYTYDVGSSTFELNQVWTHILGSTSDLQIYGGTVSLTGNAATLQITTAGADSQAINIHSGDSLGSGNNSGVVNLVTGAADNTSGNLNVRTGDTAAGDSGSFVFKTGESIGGGTGSGSVSILSGNTDANSGSFDIITGDADLASGDINIRTGGSGTTRGSVNLDGTAVTLIGQMEAVISDLLPTSWGSSAIPALQIDGTTAESTSAAGSGIILKGDGGSTYLLLATQDHSDATGTPGIYMFSGYNSGTGSTGEVDIATGSVSGAASSGAFTLHTGDANGTGGTSSGMLMHSGNADLGTGGFNISTGNSATAISGSVNISSGSAGTDSGDIILTTGGAGGLRGSVIVDSNAFKFPLAAADPTGVAAGSVYYNTVANKLKLYNGVTWETITSI